MSERMLALYVSANYEYIMYDISYIVPVPVWLCLGAKPTRSELGNLLFWLKIHLLLSPYTQLEMSQTVAKKIPAFVALNNI